MNLSERSYWVTLILSFTIFSLVLCLWLIPQNIIEYNLGIGLLTSSIFLVLTILFLSWLFKVREDREWRAVKDAVYSNIGRQLSLSFHEALTFVLGGQEFLISLPMKDEKQNKEKVFSKLNSLSNQDFIELDPLIVSLFKEEISLTEYFRESSSKISDVQIKYGKLLPSEITLPLIEIHHYLDRICELHKYFVLKKVSGHLIDKGDETMLNVYLRHLFSEMLKIWKSGIEFHVY